MHTNQPEIKGNLARLLATENLIVEHRRTATASFDVDRRVLTLPMWDHASGTVYDMLVGHEVGHALFTPNEDWREKAQCPQDFINVIEDARIEKLMKRKFPGLRKSFNNGYQELNSRDFFGVEDEDTSEFSLIDRINLHFKIGASALIPFSIEEKLFVARTDLAETFDEVLEIAKDVFNFSKQQQEEQATMEVPAEEDAEEFQPKNNTGGQSKNASSSSSDKAGESKSSDEDQPTVSSSSSSRGGGASSAPNQSKSSGTELEDVRDDMYDEDGNLTEPENSLEESKTQRSFDNATEELSSRGQRRDPVYVEIPQKVDVDNHVVDWKVLHGWINENAEDPERYLEVDARYQVFKKQSQKEVNYLVKEFECKKSADAYARAGQSKTGVLDTAKLHTYRYNEDLFKKVTILPDGKNHGLLFILDWSGSMSSELLATVKQVLNLTAFCKKVQIPFEVYAFTNEWYAAQRAMENSTENKDWNDYRYSYYSSRHENVKKNEIYIDENTFHLMNFVSSRSNSREYEMQCRNLFREASVYRHNTGYGSTFGIGLSGTPLNEAIVMLNYIIPDFKKQNDLQKVNVCVLSDGEACSSSYGQEIYDEHADETRIVSRRVDFGVILRDRTTGRVYSGFDYDNATSIFIQQVRDRNPSVNVIGFRILPGGCLQQFVGKYADWDDYPRVQKQWRKEKSAIIPNPKGYSALYAISNNSLVSETEFNVESGAKKGEISRAFKKMLGNKSTNKKLLSSFVEYVS